MDDFLRPTRRGDEVRTTQFRQSELQPSSRGKQYAGTGHNDARTVSLHLHIPSKAEIAIRLRQGRLRRVHVAYESLRPKRQKHPLVARFGWGFVALLVLSTIFIDAFNPWLTQSGYALSPQAETLLPSAEQSMSQKLVRNSSSGDYEYNKGYTPTAGNVDGQSVQPKFTASASSDPAQGISVTDPVNQVTIGFKPKFGLKTPMQTENRLVYPINGLNAQLVYTMQAVKLKDDIIINKYSGDKQQFTYDMQLPDTTEAHQEPDGSIGIYGVSPELLGNVSTGTANDAKLLAAARKKAPKTVLLFSIPAPFIMESGKKTSKARAWYGLKKGTELTVYTEGLKRASYPITIDPSVYIETAAKLMRGNNESNIDFDIDNELIQKGKTTGGRFDQWNTTLSLPVARWAHATAVAGGYVYVVGGNDGSSTKGDLYWAHFNSSTGAIEATNPGAGACTNWCTNSAYNLPSSQVRQGASLVAYNGYLYLFGGIDGSGTRTSTVYIAKLGVNGEPQLWHPTDTNKANWVYWYSDTAMSSARAYMGALAYNNRMYLVGGSTTGTTGLTTVEKYDISPIGTLLNRTSITSLPSALWGMSIQAYNDRLYAIGGAIGTTPQSTVYYAKMNTDGTISSSWYQVASFLTSPRVALGGTISTVWGGFIYLAAGCSALNTSGYCTSIANDIQIGSINADGSISNWTTILNITSSNMGYGFVAWRNSLYSIGGCTAQDATSGACTSVLTQTQQGAINQDGDVSTVNTSVAPGTSPCASPTYTNCNMPDAGTQNGKGGQMSGGTVINNGYIYYLGGCTFVQSGSVCYTGGSGKATSNLSYAAINTDGSIGRTATCASGYIGGTSSWCTVTSGLPASIAAFGYAVFNNTLYLIGGTTGNSWQSSIWSASFNSDGTIGTWTTQSFSSVGISAAGMGYMYAFTRANPSASSTLPGNLYIIGGCIGSSLSSIGLDCSGTFYTTVYKCSIRSDTTIDTTAGTPCTTTGQLQIDSEPSTTGNQGLGIMAGATYANYVYLIGGQSPNETQRGEVMYAKIDNNNNIVATDGTTTSPWTTSSNQISPARTRGASFGYNGYLYSLAGYNVSAGGSLNDLLYAKINVSDGSIGTFLTSSVTVTPRWDLRAGVNNGFVYAMGGCSAGTPPANCTSMTPTVQTFQLYNNASGAPKAYTVETNQFSTDRMAAGTVVYNGYIYVAGGCTGTTDCNAATNNVQMAQLNSDGSVGTWSTTTAVLPANRAWGQLLQAGGTLYYVGGQDGSTQNGQTTVYYATPSGTGDITSWSTATNGITGGITRFGAAVWNNRMYLTGGVNSSGTQLATVYVSPQQSSGGDITSAWSTTTALNNGRQGDIAVAYANNLYVFGGRNTTNYLNDSQYAKINSDGTIGTWYYGTSLPYTFSGGSGFAANGFMYLLGGRSADTVCNSHTFVSPISANTTIASGNNPTGVGEWYETAMKYSGSRYGTAVAYNQGKVYALGGACGSTLTYTGSNKLVSSTVQAQPQIAKYSRMIDTDTDVFPTGWLMNGLDNSTGARWFMRYRSSTAATAAWGQETNFGEVPLGTVETYTPKDSSGTTTNFARYYYLIVTIDSQQAYGYPEDVSRGPTITDLSLFFTADPSKRMIHGKTFVGGEQQPLDTPCRQSVSQPNCQP